MRLLPSAFTVLFLGGLVGACSVLDAQNDCERNPELTCYRGQTTGTGGTGECESALDCPAGNKCQVTECSPAATCLLNDRDCAGLDCNATTGLCEGCNDIDKPCPMKECFIVICNMQSEVCEEEEEMPGAACTGGSCVDGVCLKKDEGASCGAATECATSHCVDWVCCDLECGDTCYSCNVAGSEGTCTAQAVGDADFACTMLGGCGATPGTCQCNDGVKNGDETDVDCGGACGGTCGVGSACKAADGSDCVSGFCVDGYCCYGGCAGACEACDLPDHPGICSSPAAGATDALCDTATEACGTAGLCGLKLAEACSQDGQCASNNCKGGGTKMCKACIDGGAYACGGGKVCIAGTCFTPATNGEPCQADKGCTSGNCVDGVCCNATCDGLCMACHGNYTGQPSGACAPVLGPPPASGGYWDPHNECNGPGVSGACSGATVGDASSCGQL